MSHSTPPPTAAATSPIAGRRPAVAPSIAGAAEHEHGDPAGAHRPRDHDRTAAGVQRRSIGASGMADILAGHAGTSHRLPAATSRSRRRRTRDVSDEPPCSAGPAKFAALPASRRCRATAGGGDDGDRQPARIAIRAKRPSSCSTPSTCRRSRACRGVRRPRRRSPRRWWASPVSRSASTARCGRRRRVSTPTRRWHRYRSRSVRRVPDVPRRGRERAYTGPVAWHFTGPITVGVALLRPAAARRPRLRRRRGGGAQPRASAGLGRRRGAAERRPTRDDRRAVADERCLAGSRSRPIAAIDLPCRRRWRRSNRSPRSACTAAARSTRRCCSRPARTWCRSRSHLVCSTTPATSTVSSIGGGRIAWGAVATGGPIGVTANRSWHQLASLWHELGAARLRPAAAARPELADARVRARRSRCPGRRTDLPFAPRHRAGGPQRLDDRQAAARPCERSDDAAAADRRARQQVAHHNRLYHELDTSGTARRRVRHAGPRAAGARGGAPGAGRRVVAESGRGRRSQRRRSRRSCTPCR